jgi:glucose-1-phosphate thymidylyltransferase
MKGMIPAAGLGTRLRPLTYTRPKPLLPVANKPLILYAIENLRDAGINDIGLIVSEAVLDGIAPGLLDLPGVKISYIMQHEQKGIAHAVLQAREWLEGEDFCLYLGDNLFETGVKRYVDNFQHNHVDAVIGLVRVPNPREFGVAVLDASGRIVKLVEKPKDPPSDLAVAGVYCFKNRVMQVIENLKPSARGEYEITDAITGLMENGVVRGLEVDGWWKDTGRPADLLDANRLILEGLEPITKGTVESAKLVGRVCIEAGAVVRNSKIVGPVLIGPGAILENVYVGPFTSVGANAKLRNVELEFSVIEEEAELEDVPVRMQDCLIGRRARIRGHEGVPRVHRLIVSDASSLELG